MKRLLLLVVFSLLTSAVTVRESYDLKRMREYFKKDVPNGPYTFLQSPRTGLGVGTIFTVVDGKQFFFSRPEDCFTGDLLAKAVFSDEIVPINLELTGKYTWQLGLGVANAGPVTEDVKAEFEKNRVSSMTLTIGHLKRALITIKDLRNAIRNQMDLDCKSTLATTDPEHWIIVEALYTDHLSMTFQDTNGTSVGISAKILKVLFPSFKSDKQETRKGSLQLSGQNYIVAIKAIKVGESTKYAAGDVELTDVQPDEYYNVMDRPRRKDNLQDTDE